MPIPNLNQEDCERIIVASISLRTPHPDPAGLHGEMYGYDLYLPSLMRNWLSSNAAAFGIDRERVDIHLPAVSPIFYSAAWELCRRGILRPGIRNHGVQATEDGSAGNGYSITPFGTTWLGETDHAMFVPTEPGRFSEMLAPYERVFGGGFQERANEAVRCYGAHAYLACCAMCGAGAESILLHLAIRKDGNEINVLRMYKAANGRRSLENLIIGQSALAIKREFSTCFDLLKYWRDEAAHGTQSAITENEAYTSLALLLRCAQFARDNYQALTDHPL